MLNLEEVQQIIKEETNTDLQQQIVDVVREKLIKNDPGPRIINEINRNLRKLKW